MSVFIDVEERGIETEVADGNQAINTGSVAIGQGSKVFRGDQSGIWLGASLFADAPFSVDMEGNLVASSATFGQYLARAGTGQTLTGNFNLNDSNVLIDGANSRILINDGTDNRIVIGEI